MCAVSASPGHSEQTYVCFNLLLWSNRRIKYYSVYSIIVNMRGMGHVLPRVLNCSLLARISLVLINVMYFLANVRTTIQSSQLFEPVRRPTTASVTNAGLTSTMRRLWHRRHHLLQPPQRRAVPSTRRVAGRSVTSSMPSAPSGECSFPSFLVGHRHVDAASPTVVGRLKA